MNIGAVIQARISSSRLPGKILKQLPTPTCSSILGTVINRVKIACPNVIVATSDLPEDDAIEKEALAYGASVYRGSLNDVLSRYVGAVKKYSLDYAIRITSDCPCIDPEIIKNICNILIEKKYDYVSNVEKRVFPHGLDVEAFTAEALFKAHINEKLPEIREHVTYHIRLSNNFKKFQYTDTRGLPKRPDIRITVDTLKDYGAICALFSFLTPDFLLKDIIDVYEKYPELSEINQDIYQKTPFTNITQEYAEATKLLKLHNMNNAAKLITERHLQ